MAKKKTTTRKTTHRRRISGTGSFDFAQIGGLIAGAVGSKFIDKLPFISGLDPKIVAAGKIALGAYMPHIAGKSPMVHALGLGIAAGGGLQLVGPTGLNIVSGIGDGEETYQLNLGQGVAGINDLPTIQGVNDIDTISGFED